MSRPADLALAARRPEEGYAIFKVPAEPIGARWTDWAAVIQGHFSSSISIAIMLIVSIEPSATCNES